MTEQEEFYFQKTVVKDLHIKKLLTDIAQLRMRVGMIESEYDEIDHIKRNLLKANRDEAIGYIIENMQPDDKFELLVRKNGLMKIYDEFKKNLLKKHFYEAIGYIIENMQSDEKVALIVEENRRLEKYSMSQLIRIKARNRKLKKRHEINSSIISELRIQIDDLLIGYVIGHYSDRKHRVIKGTLGQLSIDGFVAKSKVYKTIEELKEHERILDEPCKCCGGLIHKPQLRHEETLFCRNCYYYNITLADLKPYLVIIHDLLLLPKSYPDVPNFILGNNKLISDLIPDHEELNRCYYYVGDITSDVLRGIFVTDK